MSFEFEQVKFDLLQIKEFELKNGRYGPYVQINRIHNISIPHDMKISIDKHNLSLDVVTILY